MKVLSLFSGVGGFDMGLEAAGMTTAFQCEIDKHARAVLDHHWPTVPKWDDVTTLTGAYVLEQTGGVDIVAWGSPCQDLSVAGQRAGLAGAKSGLFHEGVRIIKELRELTNGKCPTWSLWENVPGALSSNGGADFGQVLYEMDEAGACFSEWAVLDAQYFGVPQRRRRVFVASCFDSGTAAGCADPFFPVAESGGGDSAKGGAKGEAVAGASAGSVGEDSPTTFVKAYRAPKDEADRWEQSDISPTLNAFDVGDVRTVTAVVEPVLAFDTQFGSNANVFENQSPTLKSSQQPPSALVEPLLIDGRRVDDVRVYEEPVQTLGARMGTGGNNVPLVGVVGTLSPGAHPGGVNGQDAYTGQLIPVEFHNEAYPIQNTVIGRADTSGPQGPGYGGTDAPMFTLDTVGAHGVAQVEVESYDEYNDKLGGGTHHSLRAGTRQSTGVMIDAAGFKPGASADAHSIGYEEGMSPTLEGGGGGNNCPAVLTSELAVRRLTPLECERLMGWPDHHTSTGINGPISDSQRYKMCGNGVASPVAAWLGRIILNAGQ